MLPLPAARPRPRLAVLLCTHDGEPFLAAQLASLEAQEEAPAVVFVHDWGSRDGTRALLDQHLRTRRPGGSWVLALHDEAPGATASFLRALTDCLLSTQPFDHLLFCDQDDVWHPAKLRLFADRLCDDPRLDLLYCDVALIDAQGRRLAPRYLGPGGAFGRTMDIDHPSTLFVSTVSGMSMSLSRPFLERWRALWRLPHWVAHDWAMSIVAHLSAARVGFIAHSLVDYRQHGGNLVGAQGGRTRPPGLAQQLRAARHHVRQVQKQYMACATWAGTRSGWRWPRPPTPDPGRFTVAWTVLRGRSLPLLKTLKVAAGYAVLWPRRAARG